MTATHYTPSLETAPARPRLGQAVHWGRRDNFVLEVGTERLTALRVRSLPDGKVMVEAPIARDGKPLVGTQIARRNYFAVLLLGEDGEEVVRRIGLHYNKVERAPLALDVADPQTATEKTFLVEPAYADEGPFPTKKASAAALACIAAITNHTIALSDFELAASWDDEFGQIVVDCKRLADGYTGQIRFDENVVLEPDFQTSALLEMIVTTLRHDEEHPLTD